MIRPLAWEPPYAVGAALKRKKKKKKKKKEEKKGRGQGHIPCTVGSHGGFWKGGCLTLSALEGLVLVAVWRVYWRGRRGVKAEKKGEHLGMSVVT